MGRSSARATVEPLAALAAVFAVGVGLALYAGALPVSEDEAGLDAAGVLQEVRLAATDGAVLDPTRVAVPPDVPAGWRVNVTLRTRSRTRQLGPPVAGTPARADRPITVRLAPGRLRPGRLSVAVWR